LWNYETITTYRTNGEVLNTTESSPRRIGIPGGKGADGIGISSIKDYYGVSNARDVYPVVWYNA
jgi:hypothetical protein